MKMGSISSFHDFNYALNTNGFVNVPAFLRRPINLSPRTSAFGRENGNVAEGSEAAVLPPCFKGPFNVQTRHAHEHRECLVFPKEDISNRSAYVRVAEPDIIAQGLVHLRTANFGHVAQKKTASRRTPIAEL